MRFRPCIDLHDGRVKQIVGSTLRDEASQSPETNFVSAEPPEHYAEMYYRDGLVGGHVIMLGPHNEAAARAALVCHPGNLQVGGGINATNAASWLETGAGKVIVTSAIFEDGMLSMNRLRELSQVVSPEHLVIDLSCKCLSDGTYRVACNRWQTVTETVVNAAVFGMLAEYCSEFLVHAVDVEGKQGGIDRRLAEKLSRECPLPVTYAGGARTMADVWALKEAGNGRVDVTVGSALDIFGGSGIRYEDLVAFDRGERGREER